MNESLVLPENCSRKDIYEALIPQITAVIEGGDDLIANLANIAAMLKQAFDFHWVGFYRTTQTGILTLGPFQGPPACVTIAFERGVCGAAARRQKTIIVPDVDKFPGHIACSSLSKSEIAVPLIRDGETRLVLDVDSREIADFNDIDRNYLEIIVDIVARRHFTGAAEENLPS